MRGFFLSVQEPRNGMPKLWLDLLAPQSEGPPMWTFSSFHNPFGAQVPTSCLYSNQVGSKEISAQENHQKGEDMGTGDYGFWV